MQVDTADKTNSAALPCEFWISLAGEEEERTGRQQSKPIVRH